MPRPQRLSFAPRLLALVLTLLGALPAAAGAAPCPIDAASRSNLTEHVLVRHVYGPRHVDNERLLDELLASDPHYRAQAFFGESRNYEFLRYHLGAYLEGVLLPRLTTGACPDASDAAAWTALVERAWNADPAGQFQAFAVWLSGVRRNQGALAGDPHRQPHGLLPSLPLVGGLFGQPEPVDRGPVQPGQPQRYEDHLEAKRSAGYTVMPPR